MTTPAAKPTLPALRQALEASWAADTSADGANWSPANPSYGQCAVTTLVLHDYLGGTFVRTVVEGVSHYFLRTPSGDEIDLTRAQFPRWTPEPYAERTREYVMSHPATVARYEILRKRVATRLRSR